VPVSSLAYSRPTAIQVVAWASKEKQELEDKLNKLEHTTATKEASEEAEKEAEEGLASRRRLEEAGNTQASLPLPSSCVHVC
jgi:methylthioribose-1-phosphate isomerase